MWLWTDQPITQALVIPFAMIVLDILFDQMAEMSLAQDDHTVETLGLDREDHDAFQRLRRSTRSMPVQMTAGTTPPTVRSAPEYRPRPVTLRLDAGRATEAEAVFWEDLRRNPENGWALHGAWRCLARQGKHARAAEVQERFRKAWAGADTALANSE